MSGRNAPRSKNGCSTCRRRKVKCGEERPVCLRCANLQLQCEWGVPVKRSRVGDGKGERELQPVLPRPATTTTTAFTTATVPAIANAGEVNLDYSTLEQLWRDYGTSRSNSWSPFLPHYSEASASLSPICPSISIPEVSCANSLVLSKQDQKYFQFFPSSSIVFYYMKAWPWSSFNYLYQEPAAANNVIMRMLIAVAAGDMHRRGLETRPSREPTADDHARYHYGMAVQGFRHMLETPRRDISRAELEMIFLAMFLMVMYEWQFGNVRHLQLHLRGTRSLLENHPELFHNRGVDDVFSLMGASDPVPRLSLAPVQMLLWILYVDIEAQPMGLCESLYDYLVSSGNPSLDPDHLHQCARLWGRCFWGGQYPDQQVMDDNENYRGLELIHVSMKIRHAIWKLAIGNPLVPGTTASSLFKELVDIRNKYSDLFVTARIARGMTALRTTNTIYMSVAMLCGQILFHRRMLCVDSPPAPVHRQATAQIIEIVHKQHARDPRLLQRFHWPLLMAVIETDDCMQRNWLRQRLAEISGWHASFAWAHRVAEEVLVAQDHGLANLVEFCHDT